MNLLSIAHVPPVAVSPEDTVITAVDFSLPHRVGAVAVIEKGKLVGIFTERDVMLKVVHGRLDPETTKVRAVMTAPVLTVQPDADIAEVLRLMVEKHIRHLPVSKDGRTVEGMLSIRNVLQFMVEDLQSSLNHMQSYLTSSVGVS